MKFISENHELAWNNTLALLKPTPAQLEHGLELHKNLFCMDGFGFTQNSFFKNRIIDETYPRRPLLDLRHSDRVNLAFVDFHVENPDRLTLRKSYGILAAWFRNVALEF